VNKGCALLLKGPLLLPVGAVSSLISSFRTAPQLSPGPEVPVVTKAFTGLKIAILKSRKRI